MTMEECYLRMHADYENVLRRLGTEERVKRFLCKLPDDTSFAALEHALFEENAQGAFRAAHSLKGIAANLGLTALFSSSAALSDALRDGQMPKDDTLAQRVRVDYQAVMREVRQLS